MKHTATPIEAAGRAPGRPKPARVPSGDRPTYSSAERLHFGPNPWQQTSWDGRAAGNFIGGGAGGGLIVFTALSGAQGMALTLLMLAGLALVGGGLLSVWLEIGRPLRALNVMLNPRSSWMSRESLLALALFPTGLAAALGLPFMPTLAALLALGFVYCQARLVLAANGIPSWREPRLLPLLLATAGAEGGGLFLMSQLLPISPMMPSMQWLWAVFLALVLARALLWQAWRTRLAGRAAPRALSAIDRAGGLLLMLGSLLPMSLVALVANGPQDIHATALPLAAAGLSAALSGAWFKYTLITRAAYNQGFTLTHLPVRGRAASD